MENPFKPLNASHQIWLLHKKKPIVIREQKLSCLHFLISTCTKCLHLNASCFIQYILQKKKTRQLQVYRSIIKLQTLKLPWKEKERAPIPHHPPFQKEGKVRNGIKIYIYITPHPVSLKRSLRSQHNTLSSVHIDYFSDRLVRRKAERNLKIIKWANKITHLFIVREHQIEGVLLISEFCFFMLNIPFK